MSKILRSVYRMMKDLHAIGCITDKRMKEFEVLCLTETEKPKTKRGNGKKARPSKQPSSRKSK